MGDFRIRAGDFLLASDRQAALDALVRAPSAATSELSEAFLEIANELERRVKRRMVDFKPGGSGSRIQVRRGHLLQSINGKRVGSGDLSKLAIMLTAGSRTVPYARVQEFGGTVRPTRARNLRIPLPHILTGAGDIQGKYQIYNSGGKWMTGSGQPTFISKSGRAIMVDEGGKPKALYALKPSVKIPPRLGMGDTITSSGDMMRDEILNAITRSLRPRKGGQ